MDRTKSKFNVEKGEREGKHLNKGAKGRKWEGWRGNIASREAKLISPRNQGVVRKSGDRLAIGKRERENVWIQHFNKSHPRFCRH